MVLQLILPSGHTATHLLAQFLWQEYKDVSIWYGISDMSVAEYHFRMYMTAIG
jgi:hypothetical protein